MSQPATPQELPHDLAPPPLVSVSTPDAALSATTPTVPDQSAPRSPYSTLAARIGWSAAFGFFGAALLVMFNASRTVALIAVTAGFVVALGSSLASWALLRRAVVREAALTRRYEARRAELEVALEEAATQQQRLELAMKGSNDGLWEWNLVSGQLAISPRWAALLGLEECNSTHSSNLWLDRVHPSDADRLREDLDRHLDGRSPHFECSHRLRHEDGGYCWVLARGLTVRDTEGRAIRLAGSLTDIGDAGVYDQLTGLPNRSLLLNRIGACVKRRKRYPEHEFALLNVELRGINKVCESLGQVAGDQLLLSVAQRLDSLVRASDFLSALGATLSHNEGSHFSVLVEECTSRDEIEHVAERILLAMREPFDTKGRRISIPPSIGIALADDTLNRPAEYIGRATMAARRCDANAKQGFLFFELGMQTEARSAFEIEHQLRRALAHDELRVHYQPIYDLSETVIVGVEALVRWQHPRDGLLLPAAFLSAAEASDLVLEIDDFVIHQACAQMKHLLDLGHDLQLHVNLSVRNFATDDLIARVQAALNQSGLPAGNLVLEITESLLMENKRTARDLLQQLRRLGVKIALDDFGTGYSSLSQLHQFSLDILKIDRSFLIDGPTGITTEQFVRTIISLGRYLSLDVVAEGVEQSHQVDQLRALGCNKAQGFRFSRPIEADALHVLLKSPRETT